jgi:hypothetical protein
VPLSRPGGAQAELLAEVNQHEQQRNLELVLAEFRNYQDGVLPTGPGAASLTEFFATIDGAPDQAAEQAPKTQRSDRDVLNLLTKRARTLHLGPANYCWFTDPSRALCLKLADTPAADQPLIGMCDSTRCSQAPPPPPPPPHLDRARRPDQDLPRATRRHPQNRTDPATSRPRPRDPHHHRDRRRQHRHP